MGRLSRFRATQLTGLCETLVRKHDYDRYLAALFAPQAIRSDLFAIYAFNYEVAKIAETVSNPLAGQIRYQWWRDAIEEIYGGAPGRTEELKALAQAIGHHRLPKQIFHAMLDSRELDLEPAPFVDMTALESYADATSGSVMKLAARALDAGDALDSVARDAGIAYAMSGLLRALPFNAARSRILLPADQITKAGLASGHILAGRMSPGLMRLIRDLADAARLHYSRVPRTDRRFLPAILPAALVPGFLRTMIRDGFNPFRDSTEIPGYRRQWIMLRATVRGRI